MNIWHGELPYLTSGCCLFADEGNSRSNRFLEAEDSSDDHSVPKYKTLKMGFMCPPSLVTKYSSGSLNQVTGGFDKYLMLVANMVGSVAN